MDGVDSRHDQSTLHTRRTSRAGTDRFPAPRECRVINEAKPGLETGGTYSAAPLSEFNNAFVLVSELLLVRRFSGVAIGNPV